MDIKTALLGTSILATGLMSGLWYGWAVSVIPGTRRVPDTTYIATMQNINKAIINPAFILPFLGIPALLAGAAIVQFRSGDSRRGWLLAGAAATYLVGVLGVTIGGNVPLNDALEAFELAGSDEQAIADRRQTYETPWNRWHYFRTAANIGSFTLASAAAIVATAGE
jgi:uncharacterized membrane protein